VVDAWVQRQLARRATAGTTAPAEGADSEYLRGYFEGCNEAFRIAVLKGAGTTAAPAEGKQNEE
jgi:hypothetical protein